jgi:methionine synthase II (cobalamin-independent)
MPESKTVDDYVTLYGEECRRLIEDSLAFLEAHEPKWQLDEPIDVDDYLRTLMSHVAR